MLVLSVNGSNSQKAAQILRSQGISDSIAIALLCTRRFISARDHGRFVQKQLCGLAQRNDLIFLLSDDDLLPPNADIKSYIQVLKNSSGYTVGVGRFMSFVDGSLAVQSPSQHIKPGESITPLEFLRRNEQGHLTTNISSMIIPYEIFRQASYFMWRLGSSGRRMEYILASHKLVASLYSPPSPSALIRNHPFQESRTLSYESYLYDELVYIIWIWRHQPSMRQWGCAATGAFAPTRFRGLLQHLISLKLKRKAPLCHSFLKQIKSLYSRSS